VDTRIPHAGWPDIVDQISQDNRNRPVKVELLSSDLGAEPLADEIPFLALDFDPRREGKMLVSVGRGDDLMTHVIDAPEALWLERSEDGTDVALEILAEEEKVIVSFLAP